MHLIRFGNKLVLAAVSAGGVDTISEITEPQEVDRLAGHCQASSPFSAAGALGGLFAQLDERESHAASERAERRKRGVASFMAMKSRDAEDEYV